MKYFIYYIISFLTLCCSKEKGNVDTGHEDNLIQQSNVIDSLRDKIRVSSLRSIEDQIASSGFDQDQVNKLNSLALSFSDSISLRNKFFDFIRKDDNLADRISTQMYFIELESSGEVFQASNIIYFLGKENRGYRYDFDNGHWVSNRELKFDFSLDVFFDSLKYKNQCENGGYASIDNLSITQIIGSEVTTKVITVVCKKETPKELLTIL